jgi:urease accessory protein UreF
MMFRHTEQPSLANGRAEEWLGTIHPLVEQLGNTDGLAELQRLSQSLQTKPVNDLATLRKFLRLYSDQILIRHELPAIHAAHGHASRNEARELVAYDLQLAGETVLQGFASASRRIGQGQLQKLRPLRDERMVQRYLKAVESGDANGWHTLVYGMTLALYSLPLRQGLLGYARQTTAGFIHTSARSLQVTEEDCRALLEELCEPLPAAVDSLVRSVPAETV